MPNITRTEATGFIPSIWTNVALGYLQSYLTIQKAVTKYNQFDRGAAFNVGETFKVPKRGVLSVNDKTENSNYTVQNPSSSTIDLVLNRHKEVTFMIERRALSLVNQDVIGGYVMDAAMKLAEQVDTDLFGQWPSATGANIGTNVATTEANIQAARKALVDNKTPAGMRRIGFTSTQQTNNLLAVDRLVTWQNNGQANNIAYGNVGAGNAAFAGRSPFGMLYDFEMMESQLVPLGAANVALGSPSAGTFTLSWNGLTTGTIAFNASAATIQTAFRALTGVGTTATVTGNAPTFTITWSGTNAGTNLPITCDGSALTGGTVAVIPVSKNIFMAEDALTFASRPLAPIAAGLGVQTFTIFDEDSGIALNLTYAYNALAGAMQATLEILYGSVLTRPEHMAVISANG